MADEEENPYKFIKYGTDQEGKSSRDYTGRGTAFYANGDKYEGDYRKGIRTGKGTYSYKKMAAEDIPETGPPAIPETYEGDFLQNKKHGIGKMTYMNGETYYGQWENGKKHGEGIYNYKNGDVYSGWFAFGKKQGQGTYIFNTSGERIEGQWEENKVTKGKWILPQGTYYEGTFENNKPNGQGRWYFKNQNISDGKYSQQKVENEDDPEAPPSWKLTWASRSGLHSSSTQINDHFNF